VLILSRKKEESIIIDENIEVKIISIDEGKVRLGISAPKNVEIHRKEVYLQIQNENKAAASSKLDLNDIKKLFL